MKTPGQRAVHLGQITVALQKRDDGVFDLMANEVLPDAPRTLMDCLQYWAEVAPSRNFLVDRGPDENWRPLTFADAWQQARAIGQALLDRGLSAERPVLVLSGNSIEHGLMALGCQMVGIPYAPISPAYALRSTDFAKLRHVFDLLTPSLVFAADATSYAPAIAAVMPADVELVTARGDAGRASTRFEKLTGAAAAGAVACIAARLGDMSAVTARYRYEYSCVEAANLAAMLLFNAAVAVVGYGMIAAVAFRNAPNAFAT